jgi:hypothetical protein
MAKKLIQIPEQSHLIDSFSSKINGEYFSYGELKALKAEVTELPDLKHGDRVGSDFHDEHGIFIAPTADSSQAVVQVGNVLEKWDWAEIKMVTVTTPADKITALSMEGAVQ